MSGLTSEDVARYHRDGFVFPLTVMNEDEAHGLRGELETVEKAALARGDLPGDWLKSWPHFVTPMLDTLSRRSEVTDPVTSILGEDLLVWGCSVFLKEAGSAGYVGWHQDLHYWGLDAEDEVTAWIALSPATVTSGCMRFVAGSHRRRVDHIDHDNPDAILSRGQELAVDVDEREAVDVILKPGEMSLHHGRTFHASSPNRSDDRRIGVAVRYIKPSMKQEGGERTFATLVRGVDQFNNFELFAGPTSVFNEEDMAVRDRAISANHGIILRGDTRQSM